MYEVLAMETRGPELGAHNLPDGSHSAGVRVRGWWW